MSIRNKGSIQYFFPNEYVVIDIETTGLNPSRDKIIEIGAIKVSNDNIVDTFTTLINPKYPEYFELSAFISDLTGITSVDINDRGVEQTVALTLFKDFIGNSIIVAHNATFDLNFLYDNFFKNLQLEFKNDYVDTWQIARWYAFKKPEMTHHKVADFIEKFNLENDAQHNSAHRALNDTLFEKQIFDIEKKKLGKNWTKPNRFEY